MLTSILERYIACQCEAHGCPDLAAVERLDPEIAPFIREIWDRVIARDGAKDGEPRQF